MTAIYRDQRLVTTAGVARRNDGRFFLARRQAGGALSLKWEFPGGKCDSGDSTEPTCLVREFREEFDISIVVGDEIGSIPFEHKSTPYILVGYWIEMTEEPQHLAVHSETGWFTHSQMLALDLADSDRILIERCIPE